MANNRRDIEALEAFGKQDLAMIDAYLDTVPDEPMPEAQINAIIAAIRQGLVNCVRHPQGWCPLIETGYCAAVCPRYRPDGGGQARDQVLDGDLD